MNGRVEGTAPLSIAGRVDLGLTMIDKGKAAIIRDRYWRERTWPAIAHERRCSVTTARKRFDDGMAELRAAILLIEGALPLSGGDARDEEPAT